MAVNIDANSKPRKGARYGAVTKAASLGSPLTQKSMRTHGNNTMNKGGTRPITTGTKGPRSGARYGSSQRKTAGVE